MITPAIRPLNITAKDGRIRILKLSNRLIGESLFTT